jgi:hypothetical protein
VRLRTDGPAATYRVRVLAGSALMVSTLDEVSVRVAAGPRTTSVHLGPGAALPILAGQRLGLGVTVPSAGADPLFRSAAGDGATCERRGPDDGLGVLMSGFGTETYSRRLPGRGARRGDRRVRPGQRRPRRPDAGPRP